MVAPLELRGRSIQIHENLEEYETMLKEQLIERLNDNWSRSKQILK